MRRPHEKTAWIKNKHFLLFFKLQPGTLLLKQPVRPMQIKFSLTTKTKYMLSTPALTKSHLQNQQQFSHLMHHNDGPGQHLNDHRLMLTFVFFFMLYFHIWLSRNENNCTNIAPQKASLELYNRYTIYSYNSQGGTSSLLNNIYHVETKKWHFCGQPSMWLPRSPWSLRHRRTNLITKASREYQVQ